MGDDQRTVRILLADDHAVFRVGMRDLLSEDENMKVVAEAQSGEEAVEGVRREHPDVVVMDVRMPRMSGIEAIREIKAEAPQTEVVVVSAYDDDEQILGALDAGASGYLVKHEDPDAMLRAIRNVSAGQLYLGPSVARKVLDRLAKEGGGPEPAKHHGTSELTTRELTVLRYIAQGKKNREIGQLLGISERTVGNHIANIFAKLHVQDRARAVVYALRKGILQI